MTIYDPVISILKYLIALDNKSINDFFHLKNESIVVKVNNSSLAKITKNSIVLGDTLEIGNKILVKDSVQPTQNLLISLNKIFSFVDNLSRSIVRLNHVGLSYTCQNINDEIEKYKKLLKKSDFQIFEEDSGERLRRWFFIGDRNNWKSPLFELVLNESDYDTLSPWDPHFQIDLDTSATFDELESFTEKYLKSDFFDVKIDVPNYGIVWGMGVLGSVNKTKLCLGLGTKLKETDYHRKTLLKEV